MGEWITSNVEIEISGGNLPAPVILSTKYKAIKLTVSVDAVEVTRGKNVKHKVYRNGMIEHGLELTLGIDVEDIFPGYLEIDQYYVYKIYANDNVSGQPAHEQEFFYEEIPLDIASGRGEMVYKVKLKPSKAPVVDYFELGVVTP